jgi:hypothetical protein
MNLSEEDKLNMSKRIQDIFDSEPADENQVMGEDDDEEEEEVVDLEDQERRTEKLKTALTPLAQLWWSGSEHIDLVTEKLADGSRASMLLIPRKISWVFFSCTSPLYLCSSKISYLTVSFLEYLQYPPDQDVEGSPLTSSQ